MKARRWRGAIASLLLAFQGCKQGPPPDSTAVVPAVVPREDAPTEPRSFLDACSASMAPASGRTIADEAPLAGGELPPRSATAGEVGPHRIAVMEAIDTLRHRLSRDPRDAALHRQLGEIYLYALGNRSSALSHLCRALDLSPLDVTSRLALLAAWMAPGAELELEVALRQSDRSLAWREALEHVRSLPRLAEHAAAERFERILHMQRLIRLAAGLRRERTRSTVDLAALLTTWADAGSGELEILISVEAKHRAKTSGLEKSGEPDVISGPGFRGRRLFHSTGSGAPAGVAALLSERAQDVRLVVVAHQGTRSLILSGRAQKTAFALERFAISPDALRVRELVLAGMPGGKLVEKRP